MSNEEIAKEIPRTDGGQVDAQQVRIARATATKAEKEERWAKLYDDWKDGWVNITEEQNGEEVVIKTVEEQRGEFFADITDKEIVIMCKMDEDNPLTCLNHLVQLLGAGVIPPLPSLNHVMKAYTDNLNTIQAEICRAVRRGRVK